MNMERNILKGKDESLDADDSTVIQINTAWGLPAGQKALPSEVIDELEREGVDIPFTQTENALSTDEEIKKESALKDVSTTEKQKHSCQ